RCGLVRGTLAAAPPKCDRGAEPARADRDRLRRASLRSPRLRRLPPTRRGVGRPTGRGNRGWHRRGLPDRAPRPRRGRARRASLRRGSDCPRRQPARCRVVPVVQLLEYPFPLADAWEALGEGEQFGWASLEDGMPPVPATPGLVVALVADEKLARYPYTQPGSRPGLPSRSVGAC